MKPLLYEFDKRKLLILWSGGCDSTLLLTEALLAGHEVRTISINDDLQIAASKRQRIARDILTPIIAKRCNQRWLRGELKFPHAKGFYWSTGEEDDRNPQATLWATIAGLFVHTKELATVAWIENDGSVKDLVKLQEIYKRITLMLGKNVSGLYSPYEHVSKIGILQRLRELRVSTKYMWWCQKQDYITQQPHCTCNSCVIHRMALTELRYQAKHKRPKVTERK